MNDCVTSVAEFFRRHGLENTTGVVAVSGGPDSVALAHLLVAMLRAGALQRVTLAHVNHQLRGSESDGDESFVQNLPVIWHLQDDPRLACRTQKIDVAALAHAERGNLEGIARRERYRWFVQLARESGAAWVATGHTADDQAETVLFRLLRGTGVHGLGAMRECRPLGEQVTLVRPLLTARRPAVLDYLHDSAIPYRLDSSNCDTQFSRNRLRLELLPLLQQHYNPGVVTVLCRLAEQAQQLHAESAEHAVQLLAKAELPRAGALLVFSLAPLQIASVNRVRDMFRLIWQREGWPMADMDFTRWNRLVDIVRGLHSACDFPGFIHARRCKNVLQIDARPAAERFHDG